MFVWILLILTLIISIFGLYAFVHLMMNRNKDTTVSLLTHQEVAGLHPELQMLYRKTILNQIAPEFVKMMNEGYTIYKKEASKTYAEIEKEALDGSKMIVEMIKAYTEELKNMQVGDVKESFQTMFQTLRPRGL
jgi:hypothetical protein